MANFDYPPGCSGPPNEAWPSAPQADALVEKVARAIQRAYAPPGPTRLPHLYDEDYRAARAALDAVGLKEGFAVRRREPTEAMINTMLFQSTHPNMWLAAFDHPSAAPDGKEGT